MVTSQERLSLMSAGVQIMGGVMAILSGVILVVFFAKLDELVSRQYYSLFQVTSQKFSQSLKS